MSASLLWAVLERSLVSHEAAPRRVARPLPRGLLWPGSTRLLVDGVLAPLQDVDAPATWDDGSIAVATATWRGPCEPGELTRALQLVQGPRPVPDETFRLRWRSVQPHTALLLRLVDPLGEEFRVAVDPAQAWMVMLGMVRSPSMDQQSRGVEVWVSPRSVRDHPRIRARIRWRAFSDWGGLWVDVTVENCDVRSKLADASFQEATLDVDGVRVVALGPHVHRAGARWTWSGWAGDRGPRAQSVLDGRELAEMLVAPAFDWGAPADEASVLAYEQDLLRPDREDSRQQSLAAMMRTEDGAPLASFPLARNQPGTGDRADIGTVTAWQAAALNGGSEAAWRLTRQGDLCGSGAFQVHLRDGDSDVGVPHSHAAWKAGAGYLDSSASPCRANVAHHPMSGLLTWLSTGDERAAEELASWALMAARDNYPNSGVLQNPGDRREAWALRSASRAAVFLPDAWWSKAYLRDCLERTAASWEGRFSSIVSENPLGTFHVGRWDPSGRKHSPCAFIASPWQSMWFVAECLRAGELLRIDFLRAFAEHGWRWARNFLLHAADQPHRGAAASAADGFAYNAHPAVYEGVIDAAGRWAVKPGSVRAVATPSEQAWYRTISGEREAWPLTAADLCGDPALLEPKSGKWSPWPSEEYYEYSFGRVGLLELADRLALPEAQAVHAAGRALLAAPSQRSGKRPWALQATT